ncbi:hypothetical protein [Mycobacterium avium]|uniref:hypothetical protein n=1 Tax=Mycobacterium avium TaxID=1764 RepID=UPI0020D023CA|nr:hypothetical protein [Mycobacterium avium]
MTAKFSISGTDLDTVDIPDPANTDLRAIQAHEVITAAPVALCLAVLDNAAALVQATPSIPPTLAHVITREEACVHRFERDRGDQSRGRRGVGDEPWTATGPVQAILLDPLLASLTGDQRITRVRQILDETEPPSILRDRGPLLLSLIGMLGFFILLGAGLLPLLVALPGAVVCGYSAMMPRRRGAYLRGPRELVMPPRYPTISLDEALQLAALNRSPASPASESPYPTTQPAADQPTCGPESDQTLSLAERRRAIADVHAAITELDTEWLEYQLDTHAWFLAKPQLRNHNDPIIREYREAEAELRDRADELTDTSSDEQIAAAQEAARDALKAWGTANRHALKIGVTNLSPSEEAALGTLYGLVGQLNDRATPKEMWPQLINAITRTMKKLTTVPCTLADIAKLPVIESESRLRAIEQRSAYGQPPHQDATGWARRKDGGTP